MNKSKTQVYNAYIVQAKLPAKLYSIFYKYCKENDLNKSSGLKNLLSTHPKLNGTNTN
tara:strand:- start:268 stop:441 length:174 start_codon:yes stop_codon:yes gene_type:complete